jgi:hypothetical protein
MSLVTFHRSFLVRQHLAGDRKSMTEEIVFLRTVTGRFQSLRGSSSSVVVEIDIPPPRAVNPK